MIQKGKTNIGLVEYAKAQLGKPYWYGTFGQKATRSLYNSKRVQYPTYYKAKDFDEQIDRAEKVHDCIGLIKGYMWCDTPDDPKPVYRKDNVFPDCSADSQYNRSKIKGTSMGTLPQVAGVLVFMKGHVGIYIGNGWVIEARGHAYGVVKTKLERRPWKRWAYIDEIEYVKEEPKPIVPKPEEPKPQEEKPIIITNTGCHYI